MTAQPGNTAPGHGRRDAPAAGAALVVLGACSVSLSMVLSRIAFDAGTNPPTVLAARFALISVVFAAWLRLRGEPLRLPRRTAAGAVALGAVFWLQTGGYLSAIAFIPVSLAVLLFYTYPLLTVLFVSAIDRRLPDRLDLAAVVLALAGLALALEVSLRSLHPLGIALALTGACAGAVVLIWSQRVLSTAEPTRVLLHMSAGGLMVALVLTPASTGYALTGGMAGHGALAAALACFVLFYAAVFAGLRRIGPVRTAILMNLEPPITIVLAVTLLSESMTATQAAGAALVVASVAAAQWHHRGTAPTAAAPERDFTGNR